MQLILIMLHMLICIALIALVLLQRGKGSEMGAAFGAGASGTMFGSQGATPFMVKLIGGFAVLFFFTSLSLNYIISRTNSHQPDLLDLSEPAPIQQIAPPGSVKSNKEALGNPKPAN